MSVPRIIDAHMHIGRYWEFFASDCGTDGIIRLMNRLGIERAYSMHHLWLFGRQEEGFSASLAAYEESEGRIPFLAVHNPAEELKSFGVIEKCMGREGFIGIKIHPSVPFVCGHSGGPGSGQEQAIELALKYPNMYLDIAGDVFFLGLVPHLVNSIGAERVIFGTYQP